MIDSREVSIVVQGKLFQGKAGSTIDVLKSARFFFPRCELILSTWKGEQICTEITSLCNNIILNEDPGDFTDSSDTPININRQIVSSREGIRQSTLPFVIKTRTDLLFTSNSILQYLSSSDVTKKKIIAADFSTRSHVKGLKIPYWVCDFIYAGSRANIERIFRVPLFTVEDFLYYKNIPHPPSYFDKRHFYRYSPESYLTYMYLDPENTTLFEHSYDSNTYTLMRYEESLLNHFIILNKWELGVDSIKYYLPFNSHQLMLSSFYFKKIAKKNNNPVKYVASDLVEFILYLFNRLLKRRLK